MWRESTKVWTGHVFFSQRPSQIGLKVKYQKQKKKLVNFNGQRKSSKVSCITHYVYDGASMSTGILGSLKPQKFENW